MSCSSSGQRLCSSQLFDGLPGSWTVSGNDSRLTMGRVVQYLRSTAKWTGIQGVSEGCILSSRMTQSRTFGITSSKTAPVSKAASSRRSEGPEKGNQRSFPRLGLRRQGFLGPRGPDSGGRSRTLPADVTSQCTIRATAAAVMKGLFSKPGTTKPRCDQILGVSCLQNWQ